MASLSLGAVVPRSVRIPVPQIPGIGTGTKNRGTVASRPLPIPSEASFQLKTSHFTEFLPLAERAPEGFTNINLLSK